MKKKILTTIGGTFLTAASYLMFWPVPIDAKAWHAPTSEGYAGVFEPNNALTQMQTLSMGEFHGPEDIATDGEFLYASTDEAKIIRINPVTNDIKVIADLGGEPLGIEFGNERELLVANTHLGLMSVTLDGKVTTLADEIDGEPILFVDDVDVAPNGVIYFTDASTRFSPQAVGIDGATLEVMEHGRSGRVLSYDPVTQKTALVHSSLSFPNGIAVAGDGNSILVAETGEYLVKRIWIDGPQKGESQNIIENLPGFPDNINNGPNGTFFVGLVDPRSAFLDEYSTKPWLRKLALRILKFLPSTKKSSYGLVFQMDIEGNVLQTWHDPEASFDKTSGALAFGDDRIFFTSPYGPAIGQLKFPTSTD